MKCEEIQEMMLDIASGAEATPVMNEHLQGCPVCAGKMAGMRETMQEEVLSRAAAATDPSKGAIVPLRRPIVEPPLSSGAKKR